ncbi:ATP-binding protein (plasmid) [Azospirillum sp. A26]|uniref:sensor histidine kinase n=1 Tax=Azospirillum sp. A26 TaxID=3160607 RepID=UPI003671331C
MAVRLVEALEGRGWLRLLRRPVIVLFYLTVLAVGIGLPLFTLSPPEGGIELDRAMFRPLETIGRPADVPESAVSLPHSFRVPGAGRFGGGLYRLEFDHSPDGPEQWSVLIPNYSGRILVRVNGALLYDSDWTHSGRIVTLIWPDIITIPAPVLKVGTNTLEISAVMLFGRKNYLSVIHAGPDSLLRPVYQQHHFLLVMLPQLLFAWQFAFSVMLLILWAVRRSEWSYILYAGILFFNSISNLVVVLPEPLASPLVMQLSNLAFCWVTAMLVPFAFSFVNRRPPRAIFLLAAYPVSVTSAFLLLPPEIVYVLNWYVAVPVAWGLSFWALGVFSYAAFRRGSNSAHIVLGAMMLSLLMILHEVPILYGLVGKRLFINPFSIPIFMLLSVISTVLMWRFATALNAVDQFNAKLRREIADAEAALRISLAREQAKEREIALEAERSRLTRDLHDGIAGQLVSMVALSRRTDTKVRDFGTAAHRALVDLRLVIASMAEVGDDPGMMLANFRDHIQPQLRTLGIALDWQMHALPEGAGWSSSTALELFRLLQEATMNAAKHSGADRVTIEIRPTDDGVRVVVADKGCGGAADRPGGYGLANMRRRARAIGARLDIVSGPHGTDIILDLPRPTISQP